MATLYREYRPQNFKELVGQNHIRITLQHEIERGNIAHAYLFCGPRGVGKTTIARVFSKSINCLNRKDGDYEPCNSCLMCNEITAGRSFDIVEIDAASHTGVDNVRDNIIANSRVAPTKAKYKVFIIDEVHMLSTSAFNALLKILEEPPKRVVFILCTTEAHKIPGTIISRCQRFDFKRISISDVVKKLQYVADQEKIDIDKSILEAIARHSEGHMRDAESLLGQIVAVGGKKITPEEADLVIPRSDLGEVINLLKLLSKKDAGGSIALLNKIVEDGIDLKKFSNDLIEMLRKIMFTKINPVLAERWGVELGEEAEIQITKLSKDFDLEVLILAIEKFNEAKDKISNSFINQLPLELAVVELSLFKKQESEANPLKEEKNEVFEKRDVQEKLTKQNFLNKWQRVVSLAKEKNKPLFFALKNAKIESFLNNELSLVFENKFHKDLLAQENIRKLLDEIFKQVYSALIKLRVELRKESEQTAKENITNSINDNPKKDLAEENKEKENLVNKENKDNANTNEATDKNNMVDDLLQTFGGKIVE